MTGSHRDTSSIGFMLNAAAASPGVRSQLRSGASGEPLRVSQARQRFSARYDIGMTGQRVKPADCANMAEVRYGIDRLDEEIVALLAERFRYMDAAARIKPERSAVRDEGRKAQVIDNVRRLARAEGSPVAALAAVYDRLVEESIAYEFEKFDMLRMRGANAAAGS